MSDKWTALDLDTWPAVSIKDKHRTGKVELRLHCGKIVKACLWNGGGNKAGCCYATHWREIAEK
jgi:hypothetical protein